jgi:hypothetical protein
VKAAKAAASAAQLSAGLPAVLMRKPLSLESAQALVQLAWSHRFGGGGRGGGEEEGDSGGSHRNLGSSYLGESVSYADPGGGLPATPRSSNGTGGDTTSGVTTSGGLQAGWEHDIPPMPPYYGVGRVWN